MQSPRCCSLLRLSAFQPSQTSFILFSGRDPSRLRLYPFFSGQMCPFFHPFLAFPLSVCARMLRGSHCRVGLAQHPWLPDSSAQSSIPPGEFLACDL